MNENFKKEAKEIIQKLHHTLEIKTEFQNKWHKIKVKHFGKTTVISRNKWNVKKIKQWKQWKK